MNSCSIVTVFVWNQRSNKNLSIEKEGKENVDILKTLAEKLKGFALFLPAILVAGIVIGKIVSYEEPNLDQHQPEVFAFKADSTEQESIEEIKQGTFDLEDGLYQGSGQGFKGLITVAVEIENKTIANIWVLSNEADDEPFLERAKGVIESVMKEQSTKVDAVSGATYSSNGILEAIKNALSGKQVVGSTTTEVKEETVENVSFGELKDGTYTGEAQGFGGTIKVQVTVKDGKLSDIKILNANGETASYLSKAKTILSKMVSSNSTNVDAVSGATITSNGLIKAVRNALAKAQGNTAGTTDSGGNTTTTIQTGTLPYKDGVYYGTGTGFRGDVTVAIVIADKTLKAAIITESTDDEAFLTRAKAILDQAVAQQNTDLDAVSGATYSSNGIIEALKNAFKAAKRGTSSSDKTETKPSSKPTASSAPQVSVAPGTYQDGTYSVTSLCSPNAMNAFKAYDLAMNVTIKNDKITKISGVKGTGSSYDSINDSFITRAVSGTSSQEGVVTQIVNKGTLSGIDAVSGATCTSDAIIAGCQTALNRAMGKNESTPSPSPSPAPTKTPEAVTPSPSLVPSPSATTGSGIQYKDGIYTGTAICEPDENEGFNEYDLDLQVTVSGNRITAITNLKGSGYQWDSFNQWFIDMAANGVGGKGGVVNQIIQKNDTTGIDAVSGATCSSIAIVEACKQALESAK